MSKQKSDIIWKDRRRRLGLPLSFTRYSIKNNRFILSTGFFSTEEHELLLYRILDLSMKRTFFDKLFGVGTIILFTADESDKTLPIKKIKHPHQVRDMISAMVEEERTKIRITGREMYGVADTGSMGDSDSGDHLFN